MQKFIQLCAIGLTLAACSSEQPSDTRDNGRGSGVTTSQGVARSDEPAREVVSPPTSSATKLLDLRGLGDLRIGQPIPAGSKWTERGAQISDTCRLVGNPDFPGTYVIVEDGNVRRISAGEGSKIRLAENIGVGSTEKEVRSWFGGFRNEPHAYQAAPAKYLTAPNASRNDPALRFEINGEGFVDIVHVGLMPQLAYVEGCA